MNKESKSVVRLMGEKKGQVIEIDGAMGEGGGQIFRTAIAYSALIRKPILIYNIRAKRKNPGLRPQHLTALRALKKITNAYIEGDFVGSTKVMFNPKEIEGGNYEIDVKTAGSVSLIIQAILPALLFANKRSRITIKGGTDVPMAPPIDVYRYVFFPFLRELGIKIDLKVKRRGHYPKGGGIVELEVEPIDTIPPINLLEQGELVEINGISHAVRLPQHVAERQAERAKKILREKGIKKININTEYYERGKDPHLGPGSGIVLWAKTTEITLLSGDSLGARGKPAEKVGEEAAKKLLKQIEAGGAVDIHHTDHLIPFMALAEEKSIINSSEISLHTITAIEVAKRILGTKFIVKGKIGTPGTIETIPQ